MTDQELKDLVAGLAISQVKTDEDLKDMLAGLKAANAVNAKAQAENARAQAETEAQMKRTDETLKRMGIHLGGVSENMGYSAEDYFYNSLSDSLELGGIKFDEIGKNVQRKSKRVEDEYDIVLYNGDCIALIECKYKAHENDVKKLIDKKVSNFKELFPYYKDYKIYLGIASFSFYPELEEMAKQNGVAILKQKGDILKIEADNLKVY